MQSGPSGQQYDPIKKTSEHRGQWTVGTVRQTSPGGWNWGEGEGTWVTQQSWTRQVGNGGGVFDQSWNSEAAWWRRWVVVGDDGPWMVLGRLLTLRRPPFTLTTLLHTYTGQ